MSRLTEMLNQIALWVEQYNREEFNLFVNMRPELTFEEIQIKVEKLPFRGCLKSVLSCHAERSEASQYTC